MSECLDKFGRVVSVGSRVRLIELARQFLASLPLDEVEYVKSMIGDVFDVYEIDDYGSAWIEKCWDCADNGHHMGHSLALESHEMELINAN